MKYDYLMKYITREIFFFKSNAENEVGTLVITYFSFLKKLCTAKKVMQVQKCYIKSKQVIWSAVCILRYNVSQSGTNWKQTL